MAKKVFIILVPDVLCFDDAFRASIVHTTSAQWQPGLSQGELQAQPGVLGALVGGFFRRWERRNVEALLMAEVLLDVLKLNRNQISKDAETMHFGVCQLIED